MALNVVEMIAYANKADREIAGLLEALVDIEELVTDYVDIDANGGPNLAMRVLTVVHIALDKQS